MYRPVPRTPDLPTLERELLAFWEAEGVHELLRIQNRDGQPWSFLDGPITANNPMGVHHAWGRSYKDMFQRYHAMNGRQLRYQNGFDCQGLWVEVEVEKELGFEKKRDIADFGIDEFVARCKERVLTFAARQTEQSVRLGYWMDWDAPATLLTLRDGLREGRESVTITTPTGLTVSGSPESLIGRLGSAEFGGSYFTFSNENNYTIWGFLKKCHEQGHLYQGTDVMPWCNRCGTGLSQMEVAEGRKITRHTSVFVRFPLVGREKEALLVWTTTPWTLTSNVAAAVNPDMTYLKISVGDWVLYVGEGNYNRDRIQSLEAGGDKQTIKLHSLKTILGGTGEVQILGQLKGSELVGLAYEGPFDHLEAATTPGGLSPYPPTPGVTRSAVEAHRVLAWEEVSDAEGTGIVHIAPGCGAEDARLGRAQLLPAIAPLDEAGRYIAGFGEWTGRDVGGVADEIVADLRDRGLLLAKEAYPHVYPHCWRCKEELVFRQVDEWFVGMGWRDRIQRIVPQIKWIPADGEARELDWLKNMGDWMISKKRFWGLALPIWPCEACGKVHVLGSEAELQAKAVEGWETFAGHSPHRPFIDAIKIRCEGCGELCSRVEDVGNPWLDAGIVPYSTVHFNSDQEYWRRWFPADFVVECFPGQFRNWFYALLAMSAMMADEPPFKVLLGHALVRDARGAEMHKSSGNSIAFDEAADAFGAEVMRYLFAGQNPVQNLNFPDMPEGGGISKGGIDAEVRRKLLTWWNCYSFFVTYASADSWTEPQGEVELPEMDRWILSRLQHLVGAARQSFEGFAIFRFIEAFEGFVDEFSNWWLRRSRARFWGAVAGPDKEAAYQTLHEVLFTLCRLMAPVLPFLTEHMYDNLVRSVDPGAPISIHLFPYPRVDEARIDEALEARMDCLLRIKNQGLALRNESKIKVRQPLAKLIVRPANAADRAVLGQADLVAQICEECNVHGIELIEDESALVRFSVKPNFKVLGARFGKAMKGVAAALSAADARQVASAVAKGSFDFELEGQGISLGAEDVIVLREAPDHLVTSEDQGTFAALDLRISPELEAEGLVRDLNRMVQDQRKALDLQVSQRIRLRYVASDRVAAAVETWRAWLADSVLATEIDRVAELPGEPGKVGGEAVTILVEAVD